MTITAERPQSVWKKGLFALLGFVLSPPLWYAVLLGTSLLIPESQREGSALAVWNWVTVVVPPVVFAAISLTRGGRRGRPFLLGLAAGFATISTLWMVS